MQSFFFVTDVIFCELWNSKSSDRDSWFAIFKTYGLPSLQVRELCLKTSFEPNSESDAGKNVVISRTSASRFEVERKLIQNKA